MLIVAKVCEIVTVMNSSSVKSDPCFFRLSPNNHNSLSGILPAPGSDTEAKPALFLLMKVAVAKPGVANKGFVVSVAYLLGAAAGVPLELRAELEALGAA